MTTARRRVLVVDDSAFMRRLVAEIVESSGEFTVVGTARDGEDALRQVHALAPDLVTLDVDMPGLDGLGALERIMHEAPRPVVMLSAGGSDGGVEATWRALEAGAVEFVRKPSGAISLDLDRVADRLLAALRAAAVATWRTEHRGREAAPTAAVAAARPAVRSARLTTPPTFVVVIAASTGGPAALAEIVPQLPAWPDVAVGIAQHMPSGFTASFARRLHGASQLAVREATDGEPLVAGEAVVARGGAHLLFSGTAEAPRLALDHGPPRWGVRPAADPLFHSAAALYGARTIGVVLTGMGRDGAEGLAVIRQAGGVGLVQEAASCVVAGMPDAARALAGADAVVPLDALAATLRATVEALRARHAASCAPHAA